RVDADRIPEQEAVGVVRPRGEDLVADVLHGVGAPEREVLEPGNQPRMAPFERSPEVAERVRDRLAGPVVRHAYPILARVVVRGVDHRIDGVDVARHATRQLTDSQVAGRGEAEDVDGYPGAERVEARNGVLGEGRVRPAHRLRVRARVADQGEV